MFDTSSLERRLRAVGGRLYPSHLGDLSGFLGRRYGDRELIVGPGLLGGPRWTGADIARTVAQLSTCLAAAGVRPGHTVLVATANRVDLMLHILALARLGAIPAPTSDHLKPSEVALIADATGADAALADHEMMARLDDVLSPDAPRIVADGGPGGVDLLAAMRDDPAEAAAGDLGSPDATALVLCTSGTTGHPKAAALTSRGLLGAYRWLPMVPLNTQRGPRSGRDTLLTALPLAHVMGLAAAVGVLHAGVRWVHVPRFDADEVLDRIEAEEVNAFLGVPTMYADLESAGASTRALGTVQLWMSAADVMPEDRARRFQTYGGALRLAGRPLGVSAFVDVYGMVELSGPAAARLLPPAASLRLSPSLPYRMLPGMAVRAVDGEGRVLGWGRRGELAFRGPGVLQRYRNAADAGPDDSGWFSSGDQGRIWPGGLFTFAGRSRDRLKVSGFSVFPAEVEEMLDGYPGIEALCLVGVPDERTGERPVAVVVAGDGVDEDDFLDWARDRVQGYRRPRAMVRVEALPRGGHDKVDREEATRLAVRALG